MSWRIVGVGALAWAVTLGACHGGSGGRDGAAGSSNAGGAAGNSSVGGAAGNSSAGGAGGNSSVGGARAGAGGDAGGAGRASGAAGAPLDAGLSGDAAGRDADAAAQGDGPRPSDGGLASDGGVSTDPLAPGLCEGRWCWSYPLPQGNNITAFWVQGRNDVWGVGWGSTVIHWDGARWSRLGLQTTFAEDLTSIWMSPGSTDLYAVGLGTIYHWNGASWRMEPVQITDPYAQIKAIGGTAADDVWIVGKKGLLIHRDANKWTVLPSLTTEDLNTVVALGPRDVWVGTPTTTYHYDGVSWSPVALPTPAKNVNSLWASGGGEAWGYAEGIIHWTAGAWTFSSGPSIFSRSDATASSSSAGDIWILDGDYGAYHVAASGSAAYGIRRGDIAVAAIAPDDAWIGGYLGDLYHYDGSKLSRVGGGEWNVLQRVVGLTGDTDVIAMGDTVLQHAAGAWTTPQFQVLPPVGLIPSGAEAWGFNSATQLLHWDGHAWSNLGAQVPAGAISSIHVAAVAGTGPNDIWGFANTGHVLHYDGQTTEMSYGATLLDVDAAWAAGPGDVWAVGKVGICEHYTTADGWQKVSGLGSDMYDIWGSGPNDIWAVGSGSELDHYDGKAWTRVKPPSGVYPADFFAVAGRAANDVWVVGAAGLSLHWDGQTWQTAATGSQDILYGVWVGPTGDAWAAGEGGAILHLR